MLRNLASKRTACGEGCRGVGYLVSCGSGLERNIFCVKGFSSIYPNSSLHDLIDDFCSFIKAFSNLMKIIA